MQKVYQRINWENDPSTNTAINEDNLNKMDYALDQIDNRVVDLSGYEKRVAESEKNTKTQAQIAVERAEIAKQHALMAESYAHGGTGTRTNEAVDNAQYFLEQAKQISQSINGLIPMGTMSFADLSLAENQVKKYMFNISNEFTTDETFKEGAGHSFPAGTNVYRTNDGYWDCLAGSFQTPNGDTKDNTVTFVQASARGNISSGEKFSVIFGKIAKFFTDLKAVAFSGSYTDLSNTPTIPTKTSQLANDSGFKTTDTNTWRPLGTTADTACAGNDSRLSNARPASDVYSWAKASSKPAYTYSEVGAAAASHSHNYAAASHSHSAATTSANGYMTAAMVTKLNGIADGAISCVYGGSNYNMYYKFSDGTLICAKSVTTTVNFSSAWGSLFETPNISLGNWAYTFISNPYVMATVVDSSATTSNFGFIEGLRDISKTSAGVTCIARAVNQSSLAVTIDIVAIGRWK